MGPPYLGASCLGPVVLSMMVQVGEGAEEQRSPNSSSGNSDSVVPGRSEETAF